MKGDENIKVGISIGDINGIGCEIILKTFSDARMLDFCTPVIFASVKTISYQRKHFNLKVDYNGIENATKVIPRKINIVNVWKETPKVAFGEETKDAGEYALRSLKAATQALKNKEIDVLVTAPINKHNIQNETFKFPGHTDYLAKEFKGEALMFMVTDELKVGLLTDHVPVKEISNHLNPKLIENKIQKVYESLQKDFRITKPKIAILGINPHSGDNGVIGNEDDDLLKPVIKKIADQSKLIYGPYAADSFFGSKNHKKFDAVIAAYHDQGLIPFKTLSFGQGVNFTAGLSSVRTSPDHGTAYEIAGKNEADAASFKEAVFTAISVFKNRNEYKELHKNPLKKMAIKQDVKKRS